MVVAVQKWGNGLGIRIPKKVAGIARLGEGMQVEVSVERGRVVLRPVEMPSLKELLSKVKPGSRPELVDWGKPVGKEM